jgi:hypothetical protein
MARESWVSWEPEASRGEEQVPHPRFAAVRNDMRAWIIQFEIELM